MPFYQRPNDVLKEAHHGTLRNVAGGQYMFWLNKRNWIGIKLKDGEGELHAGIVPARTETTKQTRDSLFHSYEKQLERPYTMRNADLKLDAPPLTKILAERIALSEANSMASLMDNITKRLPVKDAQCVSLGNVKILLDPSGMLGPLFNRCIGLSNEDLASLSTIHQQFITVGSAPRFDVSPYSVGPKMMWTLSELGLYCARYHTFLYASPAENVVAHSGDIDVVKVDRRLEGDFSSVWRRSFLEVADIPSSVPIDWTNNLANAVARLCDEPDWHLYLAYVEGNAAGAAAMHCHGGVATLAIAGTLPEYRRKGCQTAVLLRRIQDASLSGCDLVVAQSGLMTTSQNNMERCGLRIAFNRAVWVPK